MHKKNTQHPKKHGAHFASQEKSHAHPHVTSKKKLDTSYANVAPFLKDSPKFADTHHAENSIRINKALADAGICSRRKAEEYITKGRVMVNGVLVTDLAHKLNATDDIYVDGQKISRDKKQTYLVLHKPIHTICTANDPEGRTTIFDILPPAWQSERLFTVGRLDYFSEGVLIITNDGHMAQKLAHPRHHLPKIYHVTIRESVTEQHIEQMQKGMRLAEGEVLAPIKARVLKKHNSDAQILEMTLQQGINRQIRRMCRDLHLTILKLVRVAQGPILLGDLPVGHVRTLREKEVDLLKKNL